MLATICPCGHVGCCIFDEDFLSKRRHAKSLYKKMPWSYDRRAIDVGLTCHCQNLCQNGCHHQIYRRTLGFPCNFHHFCASVSIGPPTGNSLSVAFTTLLKRFNQRLPVNKPYISCGSLELCLAVQLQTLIDHINDPSRNRG